MVEISVVIPTFNRRDTLAVILPALLSQSIEPERYELILVDNGSTDDTASLIAELNAPNLKYIVQGDSGRAGARNRGIKEASGKLVLFTDADIIASKNLLEEHLKFHAEHPNTASVGREVQVNSLDEYEKVKSGEQKQRTLHKRHCKHLKWFYFLTGNALVERQTLIDVGMFDEDFVGYGHEDIELGYRLIKASIPILYNDLAVNYHWHPVPFEEQQKKMFMAGISTVRLYKKYHDFAIKMAMGSTPISMLFYNSFAPDGTIISLCKKYSDRCPICRDIVLQRSYVEGIKEGYKKLGS